MNFSRISAIDIALNAKWAFTTRRVRPADAACMTDDFAAAKPGDLLLARVERIGSHKRLQLASGRHSELYVGDYVVVACGARYAPDQFEGLAEISADGADLLAGGGVAGRVRKANARMKNPTRLMPIGMVSCDGGHVLNIDDYALPYLDDPHDMTVIAGVGASMNAGKTTAVASLAHGLRRSGYKVAALKVTGTGAFGDYNAYLDAGAHFVADFVDAGMASTYLEPIPRIVGGINTLLAQAAAAGCDVAVVEFADGIFQKETAALLERREVRRMIDGVMFAAPCAASAVGGCDVLRSMDLEPAIVTGRICASPLAAEEATAEASLNVTSREMLCDPASAGALLARIRRNKEEPRLVDTARSYAAA
jgi:hypothetical protein